MAGRPLPFTLMAKPVGPVCNLRCDYCFYLGKRSLYPAGEDFRMTGATLRRLVQQYIKASPGPQVDFIWQGGEPTLTGLDFYREAVAAEKELLPQGWTATNSLQTNGTLLDDEWCRFFREERFLVGISIDGPAHLHDLYRVDEVGNGTHSRVMRGLRLLQHHGVEYNVLCLVNAAVAQHPLEVYRFFRKQGVAWIQFIPLVERASTQDGPGHPPAAATLAAATPRSVTGKAYGDFLTAVFDEWVRHDVGKVFVQVFEECLAIWAGQGSGVCLFQETCGRALVVEHNGDVYSCDHFVDREHNLGNLASGSESLAGIINSQAQAHFGLTKKSALPAQCRECRARPICNGGCPKDRLLMTSHGEPGLNYLCEGYLRFFTHIGPHLEKMVDLLSRGLSPALLMEALQER